jgi:hypothetical protein
MAHFSMAARSYGQSSGKEFCIMCIIIVV